MDIILSVIIPVYNAEKYIENILLPLLKSVSQSVEFILVNDGSSDSSYNKIQKMTNGDNRFIVLDKGNEGVSSARNIGIDIAKGKYLWFVDADDSISNTTIEEICQYLQECVYDIIFFDADYKKVNSYQKGIIYNFDTTDSFSMEKNVSEFLLRNIILSGSKNSIWNKIINRKLIIDHGIRFPIGVTNGEDGIFLMDCYDKAKNFIYIKKNWYTYLIYSQSASRKIKYERFYSNKCVYKKKMEYVEKYNLQDIENEARKEIVFMNLSQLIYIARHKSKDLSEYICQLLSDEYIMEEYKKVIGLDIKHRIYQFLHISYSAKGIEKYIKVLGFLYNALSNTKLIIRKYLGRKYI